MANEEESPPQDATAPVESAVCLKKPWRTPRLVYEGTLAGITAQGGMDSVFGPFGASPTGGTLNCL